MPSQAEIGFLIFLRCYTGAWSHDILLHSRLSSWSGIFCCTLDCHPGQEENEAAAKLSKLQQAWQMLFLHVSARSARLENLFSYPHVVALIWLHWTGWPLAAVGGPRMSTNLVGEQMCVCVYVCVCACTLLTQGMVDCTFSYNNAWGWRDEAPSNEAPHMLLGYHQQRLVTYLQPVHFLT